MDISSTTKDQAAAPSTLHVVPFSHLDLFWTGTREECLSRGNQIIATALELLERHGEFRFLVETINFLDHYLDCFPEETPRVKRLLAEGKLGLSPLWTGIYLNLPGGETLCRNVLLAKRYTREKLGHDPRIAHFGDLPGYTPQYPQIAANADIDGVIISRGGPAGCPLFRWIAPDGSRTLAYYPLRGYAGFSMFQDWHHDYQAMLDSGLEDALDGYAAKQRGPGMLHWGSDLYAPNASIAENVERWNAEGRKPQLRFSTLDEFFAVAARAEDIPELTGELPSGWPNIESSWPDIWPVDMACEAALRMAEFLGVSCWQRGWRDYPAETLEQAWKSLLDGMDHNQNGQGGEVADQDKFQLKLWAKGTAEKLSERLAWRLASRVRSPQANAFPIVVFNSLSWRRSGMIRGRAAVFGEVRSCDISEFLTGAKLIDEAGTTIPFVPLSINEGLSLTFDLEFPVRDVPATGFRTYYLVPGENPFADSATCAVALDAEKDQDRSPTAKYSSERPIALGPRRAQGADTYENAFFRLSIHRVTGEVTLRDLGLDRDLVGLSAVAVEELRGNYIFAMPPSGRVFPTLVDNIEMLENNAIRCRVRLRGSLYGMPLTQTYTLFRDFPELLVENQIEWTEPRWVRLQQRFDYLGDGETVRYGVPFGHVRFPETMTGLGNASGDEIGRDICGALRLCRDWVDVGGDGHGLTIGCDHRMWEFEGKTLRSYMIRGAGYCFGITRKPDGTMENIARPPAGAYHFRYLVRPRVGAFADGHAYRAGWELNNPMLPVAVASRLGTDAASSSLLDFSDASVAVSAVKLAEDGEGIVVRAFEAAGRETKAKLGSLPVVETDILEQGGTPIPGDTLGFRPFEIKTLRIKEDTP